jgi:spermidine synthase
VQLIAAAGIGQIPSEQPRPATGLIAIEQSPYAEIRVLDTPDRRLRLLVIDGGTHTIARPGTWESAYPYVALLGLARCLVPKPGRVLVVGVGGGSVLKDFASRGWQVDAVEIDPVVVKVAREHFGLAAEDGQVFTMDGRRFVSGDVGPYDVIVLDAFGSSSIPFHLVTQEAFGLIASRLTPGGLLAINVESDGWHGDVVRAVSATLRTRFTHVVALPAEAAAGDLGNVVLLASRASFEVARGCDALDRGFARRGWSNRFVPDTRRAPVLTDDLNPVDLWSERINVIAREDLHRYFDELRLKSY